MEDDYPVSLPVELAPENGSLLLPGSITITRTTLSVFKICDMNDEEPLFIGVCSVPLLRFAQQRSEVFHSSNALLLMSLSDHLFINASLSAGIAPMKETGASNVSSRTNSTGIYMRTPRDDRQADKLSQLDTPSSWTRLRLEFPKPEDCDRCVEALLARNAENATGEYNFVNQRLTTPSASSPGEEKQSKPRSHRASGSVASLASYGSRNRDAPLYTGDQHSDIMHSCRSLPFGEEGSPTASNAQRSVRQMPNAPIGSQRELETSIDGNGPQNVPPGRVVPVVGAGRPEESQREVLTLDQSIDNGGTSRSSRHSRGLPARSNPTDSRRELEPASGMRTPRSLRESRNDRFAAYRVQESDREMTTPRESQDGRNTPRSSHHSRGLPARSNPTDSRRELESASGVRTPRSTPRSTQQSRNSPIPPAASTSAATGPAAGTATAVPPTTTTNSFSSRPQENKREVLTPRESQDGRSTPRSSHHSRGLPARSNPTDSRRELEQASAGRTPRSLRESRNDMLGASQTKESERGVRTPRESQDGRKTPHSSRHSRVSPSRSNPADSRRELEAASGRATPPDVRGANKSVNENVSRDLVYPSNPASYNGRNVEVERDSYFNSQPPSYSAEKSSAMNTQRTTRSRTDYQYLLRNVMKLMHHRLHFMQYLHKELVHEAYLVEEAKLLGPRGRGSRSASASRSFSRPASAVSPRSPRRTVLSSVAEETARLREIEERLRAVEELHREAEFDRREAERTRRDVEREKSELERGKRDLERLRREVEEKMEEAAARQSTKPSTHRSPSRVASDVKEYNSIRSLNPDGSANGGESNRHHKNNGEKSRRRSESLNKYPISDIAQQFNQSKPQESDGSQMSRYSTPMVGNGQVAIASRQQQQQLQVHQSVPPPPAVVEYATAIVDRYIYGDEWSLLYPSRDTDVRFCALIDVCLTLKLPRRLVTITNVSVDQPGLRLTVEIYHNRDSLPREVLERRFSTQPFYFLQRLYELRHHLNSEDGSASPVPRGGRHISRGGSRAVSPRAAHQSSSSYLRGLEEDIVALGSEDDLNGDSLLFGPDDRARDVLRRNDERVKQRERELLYERERRQMTLQRERLQQQLDRLEEAESYRRSRIVLAEAQERQHMVFDGDLNHRHTFAMAKQALEEKEHLERAMVEVGYARQSQAIAQAQRRNLALVRVLVQEKEHRARLVEQEQEARMVLDLVMNPGRVTKSASQPEVDERMRRQRLVEAEAKQRAHIYANIHGFLAEALQGEMESVMGDEMTVRMMIAADEMKERIDLVCRSKDSLDGHSRSRGTGTLVTAETWNSLLNEEAMEREQLLNDEERRRRLFQREYIITTEDVTRNEIELNELDEHILMLDDIVQRNRAMLERRRQERNHLVKLTNEEQYYRKGIVNDEQDEWEMFMELFDSELHEVLLAENARLSPAQDLESPQRRRRTTIGTPRQTKPFHYMTFAPEDMEHAPTAVLAIEGMLGCSINKNLEVTSIARPLPKVDEEELQFQAGDMILDVAGYSLHSLSHLREVLGNRAMQIQHEARVEFPEVPEEELTVNPALQKYVDVLCEHHNFLVQVLRGCDIFQIIVKS